MIKIPSCTDTTDTTTVAADHSALNWNVEHRAWCDGPHYHQTERCQTLDKFEEAEFEVFKANTLREFEAEAD
jgi:hypothetical protein